MTHNTRPPLYSLAFLLIFAATSSQPVQAQALLTFPPDGATSVDPGSMFTWTPANGATSYTLTIGTSAGASDVYDTGKVAGPSFPALTLLSNTSYHARLTTYSPGASSYSDSTFTTGTGTGRATIPRRRFDRSGWPSYALHVVKRFNRHMLLSVCRDTPGTKDVIDSGETPATYWVSTSDPFQTNTTYYATLWVKRNGHWTSSSTTFTTGTPGGELLYPLPGATSLDPTNRTFSWSPVAFANKYYLIIGTAVGQDDILDSGGLSRTSIVVGNLLGDQIYYVRLYSQLAGRWSYVDSTFQTGPLPMPVSPSALYNQVIDLTSQVRDMADPQTNIPEPGTLLESKTLARGNSRAFCTDYANTLLQLLENNQIAARTRTIVFDPLDTHVIAEFYDPFQSKWVVADPTFGVMYFDSSTMIGKSVEDVSGLVINGSWPAIPLTWVTSHGESIWDQYYLDPIILFLNPLPVSPVRVPIPVPNDPGLIVPPGSISQTEGAGGTYIFRFAQAKDTVTLSDPERGQFTVGVTTPTKEWGLAQVLFAGWGATSAPVGLQVYSPIRVFGAAQLTYPTDGAANLPLNAVITWTPVASSTSYSLLLGTTPGAGDIVNVSGLTATALPVHGLVADTTYYIRLVTFHSGAASSTTNGSFVTAGGGVVVSPVNGATDVNPAAAVLQWTPSKTATSYYRG